MRKNKLMMSVCLVASCLLIGCGKSNVEKTKENILEKIVEATTNNLDLQEDSVATESKAATESEELVQNMEATSEVKRMGGISPEEALEYMKNTENLVIVEVNTAVWKKETPFMNALWIPHDEMEERYDEIPKDCPVLLHCGAGVVSVPAYEVLLEKRPDIPELSYIDAAACYGNEISVGEGIKASGIAREELFITSKVWNTERGYEKTKAAFYKTCSDLDVNYLDLYLIHWPANKKQFKNADEINKATWQAMIDLYKEGKIKAIGVSNFFPHHLAPLMEMEVKPMVNQIEFHPGFMQEETVKFCQENGIVVEAWSPLGTGRMLGNEVLKDIAAKYNKSVAQLCIRWVLQHDVLPLPKLVTASRITENKEVFDFEICAEDMAKIDALDNFGGSGLNPDEVDF